MPFPVYIEMYVLAKTRKRRLSISYDRVFVLSLQLGEAVVTQYIEDDTSMSLFQHPESGCWSSGMLVPWLDVCDVVADGL